MGEFYTMNWKDDVILKLNRRNQLELQPFVHIYNITSKLHDEKNDLEKKLIAITRQVAILRHDNTQALSDLISLSSQASSTTTTSSSSTTTTFHGIKDTSIISQSIIDKDEALKILIQTLDVTRSQLSNIQSELRSINSDNDGKERYQRIFLHEKLREQQHIINQQNDELILAKEELKRMTEKNVGLEKIISAANLTHL